MLWRVIRAVLTWVMALNLRTSIFRRTTTNIYDVLLNNSKIIKSRIRLWTYSHALKKQASTSIFPTKAPPSLPSFSTKTLSPN